MAPWPRSRTNSFRWIFKSVDPLIPKTGSMSRLIIKTKLRRTKEHCFDQKFFFSGNRWYLITWNWYRQQMPRNILIEKYIRNHPLNHHRSWQIWERKVKKLPNYPLEPTFESHFNLRPSKERQPGGNLNFYPDLGNWTEDFSCQIASGIWQLVWNILWSLLLEGGSSWPKQIMHSAYVVRSVSHFSKALFPVFLGAKTFMTHHDQCMQGA